MAIIVRRWVLAEESRTVALTTVGVVLAAAAAGAGAGHLGGSGVLSGWIALISMPCVFLLMRSISWDPVQPFFLSPVGIGLAYLWASVLFVPVLWALGFATPWMGIEGGSLMLVGAGITAVLALSVGAGIAGHGRGIVRVSASGSRGLSKVLAISLVAGIVALAALGIATGGLGVLLTSLATRREVLSGLGPISILSSIPGAAVILALISARTTFYQRLLTTGCAISFIGYFFVSGSRFPIVAFLASMLIARAHKSKISWAPFGALALAAIPFSVWYAYSIRQKLSYGKSEETIGGSSISSAMKSVLDPFVEGGLDTLRTIGVTLTHPQLVAFNWEGIFGNFLTIIPRDIWAEKPYGVSIAFSKQYFPEKWSAGTGVPPSMPAEIVYYFGLALAPIFLVAIGYALNRASNWFWTSTTMSARILGPLLTMDVVVLVKSGSDSFIRLAVIHVIGVLLVAAMAKRLGMELNCQRPRKLEPNPIRPA